MEQTQDRSQEDDKAKRTTEERSGKTTALAHAQLYLFNHAFT